MTARNNRHDVSKGKQDIFRHSRQWWDCRTTHALELDNFTIHYKTVIESRFIAPVIESYEKRNEQPFPKLQL